MLSSYHPHHSLRLVYCLPLWRASFLQAVDSILPDSPYLIQMPLSSFKTLFKAHLLYDSSTFLKLCLFTNFSLRLVGTN